MIDQTIRDALDDAAVQAAFTIHQQRLSALLEGETLDAVFVLNGIGMYTEQDDIVPEFWLDDALLYLSGRVQDARNQAVYRPLTVTYNPYGVHFVDKLFGAEVFELDTGWQVRPLPNPIGTLQLPDLDTHPTWRAVRRFADAFVKLDVANVTLGLPTIASALNIAVNLYGQEILAALLTDTDAARRDLRVINDVLCTLHRWYLENVPLERMQCIVPSHRFQAPGFGQLCGCTTQLVSPRVYAESIAPLDDELLSVYPHGGMIHLCGAHTGHLKTWRSLSSFRSFQINDRAAEDLALYLRGLREDQIVYVNAFEGMPFERIMQISDGHRIVIVEDREALPG